MCNAAYVTDHLPLKEKDTPQTPFEREFLDYCRYYSASRTKDLVERLEKHDFSTVKSHFISSVPGKWEGNQSENWGLPRLAKLLNQIPSQPSTELFAQVTSIFNFSTMLTW
jgi:Tyrosyl-DNA phosphodiesterase